MEKKDAGPGPILLVSGGTGASAEHVVQSVLVQFPDCDLPVETVPHVRRASQVKKAVTRARREGGLIVHTMVDGRLREALDAEARAEGVVAIDLMGELIRHLSRVLGREPLGRPGLYRRLRRAYFERIDAIEFAMAHDDGLLPEDWSRAEIVLTGLSRVGKTPLSMFLAVQGWKVANVPLVPPLPLPAELERVDRRRVFALDIEPDELARHRRHRQSALGRVDAGRYTDEEAIWEEVEAARREFRRRGFTRLSVTHKPIETLADEAIRRITRELKDEARR